MEVQKKTSHSCTECQFVVQLLRKRPFRASVVKAKGISHRKMHGFGNISDHEWPFRTRVVKAFFFLGNGPPHTAILAMTFSSLARVAHDGSTLMVRGFCDVPAVVCGRK